MLIRLTWGYTGAEILEYSSLSGSMLLTYVPTGSFMLLLLFLGCATNLRSIPFGYLLHLLVQGHQVLDVCCLES